MRTVTVGGPHRLGAALKLCGAAVLVGLAALQASLPVPLLAAAPALVFLALLVAERTVLSAGGETV